jgi:predicted molibdopterin-dependent oxidoreductase YjgC
MFRMLNESAAQTLTLNIDGVPVPAQAGETVAAVLLRQSDPTSRTTPLTQSPRAPYCMMGVCFECLAIVDGLASTQTCLVTVRDGMRVQRQYDKREVTP